MHTNVLVDTNWEDTDIRGKIILNGVWRNYYGRDWTGSIWFGLGTSGRLLWMR